MNKLELTGKKFGHLTIERRAEPSEIVKGKYSKDNKVWWKAKCDCGETVFAPGSRMKCGSVTSCGCFSGRTKNPGESARNSYYIYYKNIAKKRNKVFTLTFDEFIKITSADCHYCGTEGKAGFSSYRKSNEKEKYNGVYRHNGIDRVDSSIGYVSGNCVPCCKNCNFAKNNMTTDEFRIWILRAYNHMFKGVSL